MLADARFAHHRGYVRAPRFDGVLQQVVELPSFAIATSTNWRRVVFVSLGHRGLDRAGEPHRQRLGLALHRDGGRLSIGAITPRAARWSGPPTTTSPSGAWPCSREAVFTTSPATRSPTRAPSPERDERLAGVDRDPHGHPTGRDALADRQRGPHRTLGVVLVRHRRAEGPHRLASPMNLSRVPPNRSISVLGQGVETGPGSHGRRSGSAWSDDAGWNRRGRRTGSRASAVPRAAPRRRLPARSRTRGRTAHAPAPPRRT